MRGLRFALLALIFTACARVDASAPPVQVEMRNVDLRVAPGITLHVRHLRGTFLAAAGRGAPYLDDKHSYSVTLESGDVAIDLASLNALMARTMGGGHSNVKNLRIAIDDKGRLQQKGRIDKAIDIPFNVKSTIAVTPDGRLRVHADSVKGFGIPIKPLMKVLTIEMDNLLKVDPGRGVTLDGNDLLLDVARLLPAPAMRGRLTAARIEGQTLVQTFGDGARHPLTPAASAKNFIYWRGGRLSFGKLLMTETDLELVDADPRDPFDFSVDRWNDQLVAGYSKSTAGRGLKAHMPDYNDLPVRRMAARSRR